MFPLKFPNAVALLNEMSGLIQKTLVKILSTSFLTIYTYLSLNEPEEVIEKCIDFLIEHTGNDLYYHLQTNIQVSGLAAEKMLTNFKENYLRKP
jgi:hypothetical protein